MKTELNDRIFKRWTMCVLLALCVHVGASAQTTRMGLKPKSSSQPAEITKFFTGPPKEDSKYETGPLHIVYSDGTESVQTLPPYKASTEKEVVFNAVGFSDVHLAEDGQTLGWTVNVENCCTSYFIPFSVVVFRNKKILHTFSQGQMVWDWKFLQGGKQIEAVFGPVHGSDVGDDRLYDVKTGKLISEVFGDPENEALKPDAPEWAKRLQDHLNK